MKKTVGIAIISLTLVSCSSVDYLSCPSFSSNDNYYETEAIHEELTQEEYYELVAQEYAPDSDKVN